MSNKVNYLALLAMLLALGSSADAQQPTKVPRIGYLTGATPEGPRSASRLSGRVCGSLGMWRGKILSLSIDMQS